MTTAFRADLVRTVYKNEIAQLAASPSTRTEPVAVSCPKTNCGVQYTLLEPRDVTEAEIERHTVAVKQAMQQQFCPHHPPKIELD